MDTRTQTSFTGAMGASEDTGGAPAGPQQKLQLYPSSETPQAPAAAPGPLKRQTSPGKVQKPLGVVAPTLGYVLNKLPGAVSGRVRPMYTSYAEPAAVKVDGVLAAAAGRTSRLLGGARAKLFKVESRDNIKAMNNPGLLARAVGVCERAVDRVLPPITGEREQLGKKEKKQISGGGMSSSESETDPEELSSFRRLSDLVGTAKRRALIHAEVKYIMLKVNVKVWCDVRLVPIYDGALAGVNAVRAGVARRVFAVRDLKLLAVRAASNKYGRARRALTTRTQAVTNRCQALKTRGVTNLQKTKTAAENRILPLVASVKAKAKPLTLRLNHLTQALLAAERRCVAYIVAKLRMLEDGVRTRTKPLEVYAEKKYTAAKAVAQKKSKYAKDQVTQIRTVAAKRTAATMGAVSSGADKVLGKDRSKKVQSLLKAVGVNQA